jgi:hypothetical protein
LDFSQFIWVEGTSRHRCPSVAMLYPAQGLQRTSADSTDRPMGGQLSVQSDFVRCALSPRAVSSPAPKTFCTTVNSYGWRERVGMIGLWIAPKRHATADELKVSSHCAPSRHCRGAYVWRSVLHHRCSRLTYRMGLTQGRPRARLYIVT